MPRAKVPRHKTFLPSLKIRWWHWTNEQCGTAEKSVTSRRDWFPFRFAAEGPSQILLQGLRSEAESLSHGERKVTQSYRRVWVWFQILPRSLKSFLPSLGLELETTPIICSPTSEIPVSVLKATVFFRYFPLTPPPLQKMKSNNSRKKHMQTQTHRYIQTYIFSGAVSNCHSFFIALQSCLCWIFLRFQYLR